MPKENKFVEFIRNILIKTVLPFRKKKEKVASKIRLSIRLRVAYVYGKILLIQGIIIVLVVFLASLVLYEAKYQKYADDTVCGLEEQPELLEEHNYENIAASKFYYKEDNVFKEVKEYTKDMKDYIDDRYKKKVNPYYNYKMSMRVLNSKKETVYNDIKNYVVEDSQIFNKAYISKSNDGEYELIVIERREVSIDGNDYTVFFQIDYSEEFMMFTELFGVMVVMVFLLTIILASGGMSRIEPIFQPIKQMAAAADRLTVNNLKSERLNIAGTKNELKDLAGTINSMLDRLDTSYESQKQFVSDASHELRTPIAVIQGYVNMLDRWGKEDESILEEAIEAIKNEAHSMQDLVEKLLFLSRHDKKTLKLDKKIFNMKTIVDEMVKETRLVVKNRNIVYDEMTDVYVYADKQSIKQALRIFIDNAVKYSNDGDSVIIKCVDDNGSCAVSIEDTGIGMMKKDVENMFERFYRSENVRNLQINGNGLGLSLAKLIILKHTGTIKVRTQFTKGTCFTVTFPPVEVEGM